jgi:HK97 family phage major capsid protein
MPEPRTATDLLAEARFNSIMRLHDATRAGFQIGQLSRKAQAEMFQRSIDPATLAFFCGHKPQEDQISVSGGFIERQQSYWYGGQSRGAATLLKDYSSVLAAENRTYAGLTSTQGGSDGGNMIPIGFIPTVFAAMKKTDGVLEAANWDITATSDGRVMNQPSLTDTATSAIKISEAAAQTFVNPGFGNINWPLCTTWTSQAIKASVQVDTDAAVKLATLLADAFRIRFARGFGAECVSILLADAPVGATAGANTQLAELDLLNLMGSVDPAYAANDSAGFAMNWKTFLSIIHSMLTIGEAESAAYLLRKDDRGHYTLCGQPVFISPSLDDIGSLKTPVLYGDWGRFIIRHVPTEAAVIRYDELFMANKQRGFGILFRADARIMHAGGSGDNPSVALKCPA